MKKFLITVVVLIAAFLTYVAAKPSEINFARSVAINAPPEAIFEHINNPAKMDVWNPWVKLDPTIKLTYEGPAEGVGAVSNWDGNKDIGAGKATVVESVPHISVKTKLDYLRPMQSTSMVDFVLKPEGGQTVVTWAITGKGTFMQKLFCMFVDMDKIMNDQFTKGLNDLKTIVENSAKK